MISFARLLLLGSALFVNASTFALTQIPKTPMLAQAPTTVTTPAPSNDATPNPENTPKIKSYPVYDDINLISKQAVEYQKPRIVIRSLVPQLVSDAGDEENVSAFNQAVTDIVADEIKKFKQQVSDNKPLGKKGAAGSNDLTIDYNTSAITSGEIRIISIRFSIQGFVVGMAHPFHYHRVLNFDLENNQPLALSDLFTTDADYLSFLSKYSRTALERKLQDTSLLDEGTQPTAENFSNWNIKPTGLMLTFDEARVAPRVYGVQTVIVPYNLLKHLVSRNSPIGPCVYFHRSCGSDTLLTGGFIDEAANTPRHHSKSNLHASSGVKSLHRVFNPISRKV